MYMRLGVYAVLGENQGVYKLCGLEGAYATMDDESFGNSSENITNSIQCHKIASGGVCGGLTIIYASKTRFSYFGRRKFEVYNYAVF